MKFTRRGFLGAGAAATGSLVLPGCLNGAGGGGGPLRIGWYGGTPVHEGVEGALAAWAEASPDTPYAAERANFDDYWDKLATQAAGGQAPDVFRMSMSYLSDYAGRGALRDLSEAVGGTIRTADLDPDVASSGQLGEGLFGIGQSSISHAVFANSALLERVGVSLPEEWTWDEFTEFVGGIAEESGEGSWGTGDFGGGLQTFEVFARQHGTEVFTPDGSGLAVAPETVEEWFAMWDSLRRDGAAPPNDVSVESNTFETNLIVTGAAPLTTGWVQQVTFYQPLVEDADIQVVGLPSGGEPGDLSGQFLKALDLWCISSETDDPETAEAVVDFLVNDPAAVASLGLTLGVPPSEAAREALGADADPAQQRAIDYVDAITDRVGPSPAAWPSGYGEMLSTFTRLNEDIGFGRSDPATAAAQFASDAERVLGQ